MHSIRHIILLIECYKVTSNVSQREIVDLLIFVLARTKFTAHRHHKKITEITTWCKVNSGLFRMLNVIENMDTNRIATTEQTIALVYNNIHQFSWWNAKAIIRIWSLWLVALFLVSPVVRSILSLFPYRRVFKYKWNYVQYYTSTDMAKIDSELDFQMLRDSVTILAK